MASFEQLPPIPHTPTIHPNPNFNADQAAEGLHKALKGIIFHDDKAIIHLITNCDNQQRQQLALQYKTMYGEDLLDHLKAKLHHHFEDSVVAIMRSHAEYDAYLLHHAMKGVGTDESELIHVLCARSNYEINNIKTAYANMYHGDLEKALISETSGKFKHLLVSLVTGNRSEAPADYQKAYEEAQELKKAGEHRWFAEESQFNRLIAASSPEQLRAICVEYRKVSEYDLDRAVKKEISGEVEKGFDALIRCARAPAEYFAELIYKSLHGVVTSDHLLISTVVSHCERDMVEIKQAYIDKYGKSLAHSIKNDCGGEYKKLLLALIGEPNE